MRVGIIGAGASGILCAIELKKKYGDKLIVDLFEQEEKVGKKILQTGNGKCNFTNLHLKENYYNNPSFVKPLFEKYGLLQILSSLTSLGIVSKSDDEGRYYPYSESAASFLEILKHHLDVLGVNIYTNTKITSIEEKNGFYLLNNQYQLDKIVISIGGKARVKEYDNGFLYNLGLQMIPDHPGLVSVKVQEKFLKPISGVRIKVNAKVLNDNKVVYQNEGEVLFKDDSLSGIVIFSCSRFVKEKSVIELDLVNGKSEENLLSWMQLLEKNILVKEALLSLFPRQLASVLAKEMKLDNVEIKDLSEKARKELICKLKHFTFKVKSLNDYNNAQIMCGGIDVNQLNEKLQIKTHPSIYVAGEVLDIDGECGGFNLSFAWASALCVADNII
ncbi:MAG: aminoacetone oxidase family FAD-binding enzyme [Erysipelotrichaceae bacterium]|nr:aminoacetone oxidase family FAD-binding enzyme [Erysipelotrichaceae bacterium]